MQARLLSSNLKKHLYINNTTVSQRLMRIEKNIQNLNLTDRTEMSYKNIHMMSLLWATHFFSPVTEVMQCCLSICSLYLYQLFLLKGPVTAAGPRSRQPMAAAAAAAPSSPPRPIAAAAANLPKLRPPLAAPWAEMRPRRRLALRKTSGSRPTLGEPERTFPFTVRTTCPPPPSPARARSRAGMIYAVFSPFCFCCGREKGGGCLQY